MKRSLFLGFVLWLGATILLRLAPARLLAPDRMAGILALYAVSFILMFVLFRQLVGRKPDEAGGGGAAIALLLPTLVMDSLASAFFPSAYPNFAASSAGVFGGWMLICCAGGLAAVLKRG